jgi:hypothetical protein
MDAFAFEHFVARVWEYHGFQCSVSQQSNDDGIDVRAINPETGEKHLIQAKRYGPNTTVGGPKIQQYSALYHAEPDVTEVHVVTTGSFTDAAIRHAENLDVKLTDGPALVEMVIAIRDRLNVALLNAVAGPSPPTFDVGWGTAFATFIIGGAGVWLSIIGVLGMGISWLQLGMAELAFFALFLVVGILLFAKGKKMLGG